MAKAKKPVANPSVGAGLMQPLDLSTLTVLMEGTTPLLTHKWSEKAIQMMLNKQIKEPSTGKEKRDPHADYLAAFYRLPDGDPEDENNLGTPGFPLIAFKAAAVTAVTSLGKEMTKVAARQAFFIKRHPIGGDITPIFFPADSPPTMDRSMVRIGQGTADIRFRPIFQKWGVKLEVEFNARAYSGSQVANLLNLGGYAVGVGEHRPEKDGDNGRYRVVEKFSWETAEPAAA